MSHRNSGTLEFIQSLQENKFTKDILIPLFERIGYVDVHFHGGSYEAGKDVIAFKQGDFDELEVVVAQVKKFKSSKTTDNRVQWSEIVYQLKQMRDRDVPCKDGKARRPEKILFVTPYIIEVRILEEQFHEVGARGITILDGAGIEKLLQRHWPTMLAEIGGIDGKIAVASHDALKNIELFDSLQLADEIPYENIYSDLNFFIGRADTRELFSCSMQAGRLPSEVGWESWVEIRNSLLEIEALSGLDLIKGKVEQIESDFKLKKALHESTENKLTEKRLKKAANSLDQLSSDMRSHTGGLHRLSKTGKASSIEDEFDRLVDELVELVEASIASDQKMEDVEVKLLSAAIVEKYPKRKAAIQSLHSIQNTFSKISLVREELQELKGSYKGAPSISVLLDTKIICDDFNERVKWLREAASNINSGKHGSQDLSALLANVEILLSLANKLVHTKSFGDAVFSLVRQSSFVNRFQLSAHHVFDSGRNIAVYGEAGAGKSTTLHMYAKRRSAAIGPKKNEAVVFLPMNRLMTVKASNGYDETGDVDRGNSVRALIKCVLIYLRAHSSEKDSQDFYIWAKTKSKIIFIIDGLDEAVTGNPWILSAVNKIPSEFPNAQVIISARDCIDEIKDIEFLGISLLPFTARQLQRFIEGWSKNGAELWKSIDGSPLVEVATNPLLATIVCSLQEHGIKISANEPDVYRKKIELLCGQYDRSKGVDRTKTPHEMLAKISRVLAFEMHKRRIREIDEADICRILESEFQGRMEPHVWQTAWRELISPCNILVRIPNTEKLTFGHLRYQEFLAAEELVLSNHRSALDFIYEEWWRGALYLYAFNVDMEALMERVYRQSFSFAKANGTLIEMIRACPAHARKRLSSSLQEYRRMELNDTIFFDQSTDESEDLRDVENFFGPGGVSWRDSYE